MPWNISERYTHMDYMLLYKSSFVLRLLWQVGGVTLLGCIYYCGSFLFWDCCIWLKKPFMPLFFLFCFGWCLLLLWGLFWFDFLKWAPQNLYVRSRGNPTFILLFIFVCFPLVWTLLVSQGCTLFFMAHRQAEEHGEPGTDQDIDQGRSRMCSCRGIQWESV